MNLVSGSRIAMSKILDVSSSFQIKLVVDGKAIYDHICFGLNSQGKLSDDRYMIFYNQIVAPNNEIQYNDGTFKVQLGSLPNTIEKLTFATTIDGEGIMSQVKEYHIVITQNDEEKANVLFTGNNFANETAVIACEIYCKNDEWRIGIVGRGYNGGLADLLKDFGGEQDPNDFKQTPTKVSLEKKIEQQAPQLVSLVKPLKVVLEKKKLTEVVARVCLVLDISGSMTNRYRNGTVQQVINKILPIAVQFDNDGNLDCWYYGSDCKHMSPVNLGNYQQAVPVDWNTLMSRLGFGNNEPKVMQRIIQDYKDAKLPAYIVFITDGGIDKENAIKKLLTESSTMPIFWQFVGVGGSSYGVLRRLDEMEGRLVDNANFFAIDDFKTVPNDELYDRLLNEFPQWLQQARQKHII